MLRRISKRALCLGTLKNFSKEEQGQKWMRFFRGNEKPLIDLQRSIKGETEVTNSLASFLHFQQQRFSIKELIACLSQFKVEAVRLGIDQELVYKTFIQRMTKQEALKLKGSDYGTYQQMHQYPSDGSQWLPLLQDNHLLVLNRNAYLSRLVLVQTHSLFPSLTFPQQLQLLHLALDHSVLDFDHLHLFINTISENDPSFLVNELCLSDLKRFIQLAYHLQRLSPSEPLLPCDLIDHLVEHYISQVSCLDLSTYGCQHGVYLDALACPQMAALCSSSRYREYQQVVIDKVVAGQDQTKGFSKNSRDVNMMMVSGDLVGMFGEHDDPSVLRLVNQWSHLQPRVRMPLEIESLYAYGLHNIDASLLLTTMDNYINASLEHRLRPKYYRSNGYEPTAELITKIMMINALFSSNFIALQKQLPHPQVAHKISLTVALLERFLNTILTHTTQNLRRDNMLAMLLSMVQGNNVAPEMYRPACLDFFSPSFYERFSPNQENKQPEHLNRFKNHIQQLYTTNEEYYLRELARLFTPVSNEDTPYRREVIRSLYLQHSILEMLANFSSVTPLREPLLTLVYDCFHQIKDFHLAFLRQMPFFPRLFLDMFRLDQSIPDLFSAEIKKELVEQREQYQSQWGQLKDASSLLDWVDAYCHDHQIEHVFPEPLLSNRFIHHQQNNQTLVHTVSPQEQAHRQAVLTAKHSAIRLIQHQDLLKTQYNEEYKTNLVNFLLEQPWTKSILNTGMLKKQVEVVLEEQEGINTQKNHLDFPFFADFLIHSGDEKIAVLVLESDKIGNCSPLVTQGYWQQCSQHFKGLGYQVNRVAYEDFNIEPKVFLQNILGRRKKSLQREDPNEGEVKRMEGEQVDQIREEHVRKQRSSKQVGVELSEEVLNIIDFQ